MIELNALSNQITGKVQLSSSKSISNRLLILSAMAKKKLKLSNRDGSRLALRLERRGLISREKILQKDRWTYKLIIEQTPISLESLQNSPCLTCPVEQKCDVSNVYPEPSPLNCQLIEDWIVAEFSKKRK